MRQRYRREFTGLLSSPFLCSGFLPSSMKGSNWRVFLSHWPPPIFLSTCGNKATGTQCCPFPGPHPRPMRQPVVMAKGKAHTLTSPVSQVRQWDVGICCTAQVTSAPLQSHHRVPSRPFAKHSLSCSSPHSTLSLGFEGQEISGLPWVTGLPDSPRCHHLQMAELQAKGICSWFCRSETLAECSTDLLVLKRSVIFAFRCFNSGNWGNVTK